MNATAEFSDIKFKPRTLGYYYIKKSILKELKKNIKHFEGIVLDVGCGDMPYKSLLLSDSSKITRYIGMDIQYEFANEVPDIIWDGKTIPLPDNSVDTVILTEVLEHCPYPEIVLSEIYRVLRSKGTLFLTVPFLWMLHEVPHDEYRYTPFSLKRHLINSGFKEVKLESLGGWNASLAQMIALWVEYKKRSRFLKWIFKIIAIPIYLILINTDSADESNFDDLNMITGISGLIRKD